MLSITKIYVLKNIIFHANLRVEIFLLHHHCSNNNSSRHLFVTLDVFMMATTLCASKYLLFWKRQNYGDKKAQKFPEIKENRRKDEYLEHRGILEQ